MGKLWPAALISFGLCLSATSAAFDIPSGLTQSDRQQIIRTLGLNSASKMTDNPYPLGGYSGFEFGYSIEIIDIEDIHGLGCTVGSQGCANTGTSADNDWRYSRFTIGKGLFHDIDVFFSFIPPLGNVGINDYGGSLRWSFYQARFLPINLSLLGSFDQLNFKDDFTNRNIGLDLIAGVTVDNFAFYFGGGYIQASGTFVGSVVAPDGSVDPASNTVTNKIDAAHVMVGLSIHYEELFIAGEVDRYQDAVYSLKTGLRF